MNLTTGDQLQKVYILPQTACCEPYIKAFQYKVLNSILYISAKLYKIGFATDDTCSFCKSHPETLSHLFLDCIYSQSFWKRFELYLHFISREFLSLSLKVVIFKTPLAKLLVTDSLKIPRGLQKTNMLPEIVGLKHKVKG